MKNSSDTNGNQTHNLPACSAVPQQTAPPCAPLDTPSVQNQVCIYPCYYSEHGNNGNTCMSLGLSPGVTFVLYYTITWCYYRQMFSWRNSETWILPSSYLSVCPSVYLYGTTCTGWSSVKSYTGWFLLRSVEKITGYILTKIMDKWHDDLCTFTTASVINVTMAAPLILWLLWLLQLWNTL